MNSYVENDNGAAASKNLKRMVGIINQTEDWFEKHRADEIVRNMSYYRGTFWQGDGVSASTNSAKKYSAERNEVFPIVDTIVSSLAMDLPQVEALDQRQRSYERPGAKEDDTFAGRRIAAALNWFASEDAWDSVVQELVLHAELFDEGGVVKVSWSPTLGRPICRVKMPWEIFFDPNAKRIQDAAWSFERFVIHHDDLVSRFKSNVYDRPSKSIKADTYPRTIIEQRMPYDDDKKLKESGLKEYVSLVEFWDYRKQKVYHIHPDSKQILMETPVPYGRPYEVLVFHDGVGRIRGISDVSLIATTQRDINELVSARREIVGRLPRRMLVDKGLFRSEEEWERFKNSRSWEPTLVEAPPDLTIDQRIYVTPEMPTTFDFNQHLAADVDHVRWVPGMGDYQHGAVKNIRAAAEANMVRGAVEGRLNIRSRRVTRVVTNLFKKMLETFQWALRNPQHSGLDLQHIWMETQADVDLETFANDILNETPKFRLLPFSPLMEDKIARRENFNMLLQSLAGTPIAEHLDWREIAKELQDLYGFRPSIIGPPPPPPQPEGMEGMPAVPGEEAVPGMEGMPATPEEAEQMAAMMEAQALSPAGPPAPAGPPIMPFPGGITGVS